jgi:hypothetical protein
VEVADDKATAPDARDARRSQAIGGDNDARAALNFASQLRERRPPSFFTSYSRHAQT